MVFKMDKIHILFEKYTGSQKLSKGTKKVFHYTSRVKIADPYGNQSAESENVIELFLLGQVQ